MCIYKIINVQINYKRDSYKLAHSATPKYAQATEIHYSHRLYRYTKSRQLEDACSQMHIH